MRTETIKVEYLSLSEARERLGDTQMVRTLINDDELAKMWRPQEFFQEYAYTEGFEFVFVNGEYAATVPHGETHRISLA